MDGRRGSGHEHHDGGVVAFEQGGRDRRVGGGGHLRADGGMGTYNLGERAGATGYRDHRGARLGHGGRDPAAEAAARADHDRGPGGPDGGGGRGFLLYGLGGGR